MGVSYFGISASNESFCMLEFLSKLVLKSCAAAFALLSARVTALYCANPNAWLVALYVACTIAL